MLEQVLSLSIPMLKFASLLGLRIMSLPESSPGGVGVGGGGCPGLNPYIKMLSCKGILTEISDAVVLGVLKTTILSFSFFIISVLTKS